MRNFAPRRSDYQTVSVVILSPGFTPKPVDRPTFVAPITRAHATGGIGHQWRRNVTFWLCCQRLNLRPSLCHIGRIIVRILLAARRAAIVQEQIRLHRCDRRWPQGYRLQHRDHYRTSHYDSRKWSEKSLRSVRRLPVTCRLLSRVS